jgi:preprotein translocase subunit Sss1
MASLQERLENLWRDIRWVISTASRPDDDEFKLTARFLVLLAFIAGVFQIAFHIAGVYLKSAVAKSAIPTLGDPVKGAIAALTSIGIILAALFYLIIKLR